MSKPDWIYPGAEVVVYQDRGEGRRMAERKKVLKLAGKSFTVEGPNSVSPYRFSYEKLSMRWGGEYGGVLKVEPPDTLLADELMAERRRIFREHHAWKAAEEFRRAPSDEAAEKVIQLMAAYQQADRQYRDCANARKSAADAER